MTTNSRDIEALLADPRAVCQFMNRALFTGPRSIIGDVLEGMIRGCMKASGEPKLLSYQEAVAFMFLRFDSCIAPIQGDANADQAKEYLLDAPLPVRQIIHNAAIELAAQEH